MNKGILALCDREEAYLYHLAEYLEKKGVLPFEIHAFTNRERLVSSAKMTEIELLLIAESEYVDNLNELGDFHMIVLNESGNTVGENIANINKYQSSEGIFRELINSYAQESNNISRRLTGGRKIKIIGNYSPVRRCLQTTFALCMGQILAKKHRTLYLNFESYSGFSQLFNREFTMDITDVFYFFNCEKEKLPYRLAGIVQSVNKLDLIPPVVSYRDLASVSGEQWIRLFRELEEITDYEYLILDLSEQMQGLFDILRNCFRVYTIIREDSFAAAKIRQYDTLLNLADYEDIKVKTTKCSLPVFHNLPGDLAQLTHGELAAYVHKVIEEDIYERTN